jgi:hypothetical protein
LLSSNKAENDSDISDKGIDPDDIFHSMGNNEQNSKDNWYDHVGWNFSSDQNDQHQEDTNHVQGHFFQVAINDDNWGNKSNDGRFST